MTWTKLTDELPDRAARAGVGDAAFRTHVEGLIWAMRRENGGLLDQRDIRRACETDDPDAAVAELVACGWWRPAGEGRVQIVENMDDQPEPDVIEARRVAAADRQRRHRRKLVKLDQPQSSADATTDSSVTGHVTPLRDALPGSGRVGTGRDTRSTERKGDVHARARARGDGDWPAVAEPGSDWATRLYDRER